MDQQATFDKRERRTLRSKITKLVATLPKECGKTVRAKHNHHEQRKRFILSKLNKIRSQQQLEQLNKLDISSDVELDEYGKIVKHKVPKERKLSPKSILITQLNPREFEMVSEDPAYFIQDKHFRNALESMLLSDWDQKLYGEKKENTIIKQQDQRQSGLSQIPEISQHRSRYEIEKDRRLRRDQINSLKYQQIVKKNQEMQKNFRQKMKTNHQKFRAKYQNLQDKKQSQLVQVANQAQIKEELGNTATLMEKHARTQRILQNRMKYEVQKEKAMQNRLNQMQTVEKVRNFLEIFEEIEQQHIIQNKQKAIEEQLAPIYKQNERWERIKTAATEQRNNITSRQALLERIMTEQKHKEKRKIAYLEQKSKSARESRFFKLSAY